MCCDTYGTKIYKEGSKISSGTISGGDDSEWSIDVYVTRPLNAFF
jgi:hypothetical protein